MENGQSLHVTAMVELLSSDDALVPWGRCAMVKEA